MALIKKIELENGVITNYHRILSISKIINKKNTIEIVSYVSKEKRQKEKNKNDDTMDIYNAMNIYVDATYIDKEYDENETVKDAYNYLKTLDKFKNSTDDFDEY